jgi:outer membrane protein assembly factor BamB
LKSVAQLLVNVICLQPEDPYMANPSQSNTLKTWPARKWLVPLTLFVAALLVASLLLYTFTLPKQTPESEKTDKLFQQNLKEFANTIAVDDGKFFILNDHGNLTCLDAQNGELLWQTNVGNWRSGGLLTDNGTIYAGIGHGAVQAVDEATGRLLTRYYGLVSTAWKGPPEAYSIADGRIFITQDGINAYNIATGEMLWKSNPISMLNPEGMPYTRSIWAFEGKLVLAAGGYQKGDGWFNGIYRIDPDQGTPQWSIEGYTYQTPVVFEKQSYIVKLWGQSVC